MFFAKRSDPRPIHIIFDEVDQFCPEQPAKGEIEMARSVERLAKLGRKRGIGVSLTTQAPASVSKRLLEICDLIFFMQLSGRNTLKAVVETLQNKISDEQMLELKRGVAQLQLGEAYAWSPGWLRIASPHRFEATMCCGCGAVIVS